LRDRPVRHGAHHARRRCEMSIFEARPAAANALSRCPQVAPNRHALIATQTRMAAQKWTHPISLISRTQRELSTANEGDRIGLTVRLGLAQKAASGTSGVVRPAR
jgi:hypothetical protein